MGRVTWGALLLGAGAMEWWGVTHPNHNGTLSEFTRWSFHTKSPIGRLAFVAALILFAKHILKGSSSL
jgi:hypothetical protein